MASFQMRNLSQSFCYTVARLEAVRIFCCTQHIMSFPNLYDGRENGISYWSTEGGGDMLLLPDGFVDPDDPENVYSFYGKPFDSGLLELTAFSDADHAGCLDTRKSTSGGIQFLGDKTCKLDVKETTTALQCLSRGRTLPEDRFKYILSKDWYEMLDSPVKLEVLKLNLLDIIKIEHHKEMILFSILRNDEWKNLQFIIKTAMRVSLGKLLAKALFCVFSNSITSRSKFLKAHALIPLVDP
ncbi:hypothetical protein Tco_1210152 [Tanacetum coccineum]